MPGRFHLSTQSPDPIYRQIAAQVRLLIAGGQLMAGDEIPSVRAMASTHAVNPMTVSKAYTLLETEGVLCRNRGAAMTVAPMGDMSTNPLTLLQPTLRQIIGQAKQLKLTQAQLTDAIAEMWPNE